MARRDLDEAREELDAAVAVQEEIDPVGLIDTRLALADLQIHRLNFGQARRAATAARDAALEYGIQDSAILAQAAYVRALLAGGVPLDVQTARDRWTLTRSQATEHPNARVRFTAVILNARIDVLTAREPEPETVRAAVAALLRVAGEAESLWRVDAFEARLTLAEIRRQQGEDADLDALAREARGQGWELVAQRAEALAHEEQVR
jgi:hypothetical protein